MPIYEFQCKACKYRAEELHSISEVDRLRKPRKCPKCKRKQLVMRVSKVANTHTETIRTRRTMKKRFAKRNARLEAMPMPQQERMKRFMRKYGVKKDA